MNPDNSKDITRNNIRHNVNHITQTNPGASL